MQYLILNTLLVFTDFLCVVIFLYILMKLLKARNKFYLFLVLITDVIFDPLRHLQNKSVIKSAQMDFSPLIAFGIIRGIQQILFKFI